MKTPILKTLLIFVLLSFYSCSSNDIEQGFTPTLPAITETGANTFGCYIDGKLLTPRDGSGGIYGIPKGIRYFGTSDNSYNEIKIDDRKSEKGGLISIHILELRQNEIGTYFINQGNCDDGIDSPINTNIYCRVYDAAEQVFKWYCSIENAGTLTITRYDLDNRIVSGIFSCTMQNKENPNEQIEITDGRFDIKWNTLDETEFP
jgi:hypothetical protein